MTDIDSLIRLNLEIEGLLRVVRERDDDRARSMLAEKAERFATDVYQWLEETPDYVFEPDRAADEPSGEEVKHQEAVEPEIMPEAEQAEEVIDRTPDELPADDSTTQSYRQNQARVSESEQPASESEQESESVPATDADSKDLSLPEQSSGAGSPKVLKAFTLNDRFRYTRELFGGDADDFSDTIRIIADMDSYSEAEQYLCQDMLWDSSNPAVTDFLAVLAENMK